MRGSAHTSSGWGWAGVEGGFFTPGQWVPAHRTEPVRAQVRHAHTCLVSVGNPFVQSRAGFPETLDAPRLSLSEGSADIRAPNLVSASSCVTWDFLITSPSLGPHPHKGTWWDLITGERSEGCVRVHVSVHVYARGYRVPVLPGLVNCWSELRV